MKKTFFLMAAAVACLFGMTSCEGEDINLSQFTGQDVLGHITLTATNVQQGQPLTEGQTIELKSAMCNVKFDTVYEGEDVNVDAGALFVGTASDIIANGNTSINFPLCGINLRDTVAKNYVVSCPIDNFDAFEYAKQENWNALLISNSVHLTNVIVLAMDEENYFLGYDGSINITEFSAVGGLVKGQINNMRAFYITKAQMEALWAMTEEERGAYTPVNYFQSVTLNGEISSRRANIADVVNTLNEL